MKPIGIFWLIGGVRSGSSICFACSMDIGPDEPRITAELHRNTPAFYWDFCVPCARKLVSRRSPRRSRHKACEFCRRQHAPPSSHVAWDWSINRWCAVRANVCEPCRGSLVSGLRDLGEVRR